MDFKFIDSNKGDKCLIFDDFKFRQFRKHKIGNVVWRCFKKNCTTMVTPCCEIKNILKTYNTNEHEQMEPVKIKIQEVRNKCKRQASDDIHKTP